MLIAPPIAVHCCSLLTICPRCCPRHAPDDATDMPLSIIFDFLKAPAFQNTSTWWVFSALYQAVPECTRLYFYLCKLTCTFDHNLQFSKYIWSQFAIIKIHLITICNFSKYIWLRFAICKIHLIAICILQNTLFAIHRIAVWNLLVIIFCWLIVIIILQIAFNTFELDCNLQIVKLKANVKRGSQGYKSPYWTLARELSVCTTFISAMLPMIYEWVLKFSNWLCLIALILMPTQINLTAHHLTAFRCFGQKFCQLHINERVPVSLFLLL